MIEKIQDYLSRPMIEWSHTEELIGCLVILLYILFMWAVGEIVYIIEQRKGRK